MLEFLLISALQTPVVALASTSDDTRLPQDPIVHDEAWIRREDGPAGAKVYLSQHNLMALLGDLDGDQLFDAPSDVDALCWLPRAGSSSPAPVELLFSMLSNTGPYLDGDLLRLVEGQGVKVEVGEADFIAALLPASGSFDLDAAAWLAPAELWFSVADDLKGTVLGDVSDGDVLVYDLVTKGVRREYSEAQMQSFVDQAQGQAGQAIGDVLSLAFYPPTGELAFTAQSPSSDDATVFGTGTGGRLIPGFHELNWDFQDPAELDALAFVPGGVGQPPILATDLPFYSPGDIVRFKLRFGIPGSIARGYRAQATLYTAYPGFGIGFFFLDPADPWLQYQVANHQTHPQVVDSSGSAVYDWVASDLPAGVAYIDWYFQAVDNMNGGLTPPIVLRIE